MNLCSNYSIPVDPKLFKCLKTYKPAQPTLLITKKQAIRLKEKKRVTIKRNGVKIDIILSDTPTKVTVADVTKALYKNRFTFAPIYKK